MNQLEIPPHRYSQKLINETITIFREENGVILSEEMAEQCLNNLAGLFLAFARPNHHSSLKQNQ